MSLSNKYMFVVASLLIAGVFAFFSPVNANAGSPVPGCCITNGGQCSPSCGPAGSSCQNPDITKSPGQCQGAMEPDLFCFQLTSNTAECRQGMFEPGCDSNADCDDSNDCTDDTCVPGVDDEPNVCQNSYNASIPGCETGPVTIVPTLNQWGIIFATVILGLFAVVAIWRSRESDLQ